MKRDKAPLSGPIPVRLREDLVAQIEALAQEYDMPVSKIIRWAIRAGIKAAGELLEQAEHMEANPDKAERLAIILSEKRGLSSDEAQRTAAILLGIESAAIEAQAPLPASKRPRSKAGPAAPAPHPAKNRKSKRDDAGEPGDS